ncbi:hypothetical protein EFA69_06705 [Rufibacter immobilis]|uniref:Uncharacterized protein n=1 Tax=Rufibacter immobilis TaxID=1348778 RepID=A0A3M9MZ13_9BACT|nr:hypothetical protein EFA69_06705 [Rufibacter immobilis]
MLPSLASGECELLADSGRLLVNFIYPIAAGRRTYLTLAKGEREKEALLYLDRTADTSVRFGVVF